MGSSKKYDLDQRTYTFARSIRTFARKIPRDIGNIEANESLSRKDFFYRIKICRKEAKESFYWLRLLHLRNDSELEKDRKILIDEATQLVKIFSSIVHQQGAKSG